MKMNAINKSIENLRGFEISSVAIVGGGGDKKDSSVAGESSSTKKTPVPTT